ncbi:MAG: radical SAM protein, partial [Bacteroidota bacterium]
MTTFLFRDIIFGPVKSRRLGISLGINLLPNDCKLCNFNCIYCECGWTPKGGGVKDFHLKENVSDALEKQLARMQKNNDPLDAITFAGNGEPSMHPDFEDVIAQTILLRNRYYPKARIAVLSNATLISRKSVFNALKRIDDPILKIDSVFNDTVSLLNNPPNNYDIGNTIQLLKNFNGDFVLQTMFVRGIYKGRAFD